MKRLFIILLIIGGHTVFAQNVNDAIRLGFPGLGSSARALGMGNAYVGLSDDASASYFNPAGFGLLRKLEFSGGLDFNNFGNETTLLNTVTDGKNNKTRLSSINFAFPFPTMRGSLVFGLSYHNNKDFNNIVKFKGLNPTSTYIGYLVDNFNANYDSTGFYIPYDLYLTNSLPGRDETILRNNLIQSGSIINSGGINNWTLSGAVEIYKNLFVGLNINIISGTFESDNDYYEDDTENRYQGETVTGDAGTTDFRTFYLNRLLDWDLSGWDAKLGVLYQFNRFSRVGFTVQFPKSFSIEEKYTVSGYSQFANSIIDLPGEDYSDEVKYEIITPFEFSGGFALNFIGMIFSAEATLIDYSQMEFSGAGEGLGEQYVAGLNKDIKDVLGTVFNYNLGVEYTIPRIGLRLRAGYLAQTSPYIDDPTDYDRKYVTAGIGFLADETVGLDLGFAHGWWKDFGDNYGTGLSRTAQEISTNKFILTGTYRF